MLFFASYQETWSMCFAMFMFFAVVALLATLLKIPRLERELPPALVFWGNLVVWFVFMSVLMTLIDKPHLDLSNETKDWLFMFSTFLGIPVSIPFFAAIIWALFCMLEDKPVMVSHLALVLLGSFGLGCAVSNVHDVAWCGIITNGYSEHHPAGYDLDVFVAFAKWFGIPRSVSADYATLGPCALVLILGELLVTAASWLRLREYY
jgi:hypothetical protein